MAEESLSNKYRDKVNIELLRVEADALREDVNAIKVDLTNFVGALLQSGIVELVKDEEGNVIYKINKVVLVDEQPEVQ
jgi:hypothetical protein